MNIRFVLFLLMVSLTLQACTPAGPDKANLAMVDPQQVFAGSADFDSLAFQTSLKQFQSKTSTAATTLRKQAEDRLRAWRDFEDRASTIRLRRDNPLFMESVPWDKHGFRVGLARSVRDLEAAIEIDPTFAEAWAGLGHLRLEIGDVRGGLVSLEKALLAAAMEAEQGSPLAPSILLQVHRDRCWALRDLALWEDGLAAADEALAYQPGDPDCLLIKGLLLAGAGRQAEAMAQAIRLPAFPMQRFDKFHLGLEVIPSDYATRWIRSQVRLTSGDAQGALRVFGALLFTDAGELQGSRYLHGLLASVSMTHHHRFWNDAGLLGELAGAQEYPRYYMEAYRIRDYRPYYPAGIHVMGPLVFDVPDERAPCFLSYGSGYFLGGSPFAYVAAQMDIMSLTLLDDRKQVAAERALQNLEVLMRRNLMPDICLALKGRVHYRQGKLELARQELAQARDQFQKRQEIDARTSLLLGVLALDKDNFLPALTYLRESARADSTVGVTWRSQGVALASLGRLDAALVVMNRALAMEPASLAGYYNRGLLFLQRKNFTKAMADLDYARQLDPGNPEIVRLLQTCAVARRQQGDTSPLFEELASPTTEVGIMLPEGVTTEIPADLLLDHLWGELEKMLGFAEGRQANRAAMQEAGKIWVEQYSKNPNPNMRKVMALLWLDLGQPAKVSSLLQSGWGKDLEPDEEVMLLFADSLVGHPQRARGLALEILAGQKEVGNPYIAALAAKAVLDKPGDLPPGASESIIARWIDHNGQTAGHSLHRWHTVLVKAFGKLRQNFQAL